MPTAASIAVATAAVAATTATADVRSVASDLRFSPAAKPIWHPSPHAAYVFLQKEVHVPSGGSFSSASIAVTAATSGDKEKLLGAYRLYVNGRSIGIGPGRGDVSTNAQNHTMFDHFTLSAAELGSGSTVVLGLQSFALQDGKVILEGNFSTASTDTSDTSSVSVATDKTWKALDATSYYNPSGNTGGAYVCPQENIVAAKFPGAWTTPGFDTSNWEAATETESFGFEILPKVTLPLNITTGVVPPVITPLSNTTFFFDLETDRMAGVRLEIPAGAIKTKYIQVTLSEELNGPYGSGQLLYPMRTTNHYRYLFTPNPVGPSVIELHEYALFRYGLITLCDDVGTDGSCGGPPAPAAQQCAIAQENTKLILGCYNSEVISDVLFADYGVPTGECKTTANSSNTFHSSTMCTTSNAVDVIKAHCLHKTSCSLDVQNSLFVGCRGCMPDGDPCHHTTKHLSVAIACASPAPEVDALPFSLSLWTVAYPWNEGDSHFSSSNDMLNRVYELCRNTLRVTSLDTTTDSNTRERLPYEADGYITGNSRYLLQRETNWQLHSARHNFLNPTWPTEWRQFMPLIAYEHFMQTGDTQLPKNFWDLLLEGTQVRCVNTSTQLVDFSKCARQTNTRDIVDWPTDARDGYVMTDVNTVINSFLVGSLHAMARMGRAVGRATDADRLEAQANATAAAMVKLLLNTSSGLMVDGLDGAEKHSAWHAQTNALWFGVPPQSSHPAMLKFLRGKRITGSVYAVFSYMMALYSIDGDHGETALEMLTQCDDNSWCHMLNVNATATMEAWTRAEKPNLSWSHPWATAPITAIVRGLLGLVASTPAYTDWVLKPQLGNLTWVDARVPSQPGFFDIAVNATVSSFALAVTAPTGTSGVVCTPAMGSTSNSLTVDGKTVQGTAAGDYVCTGPLNGGAKHTVSRG